MKTVYRVKLYGRELMKNQSKSIELNTLEDVEIAVAVADLLEAGHAVEEIKYNGQDDQAGQDCCAEACEPTSYYEQPRVNKVGRSRR